MSSLDQYQECLTKAPYGITINALSGEYVNVNQSFIDICEYSEEELLRMRFQDLTHPEDVAPNVELDSELKNGSIPYFQMAKRYITKSGKQKRVLIQVSLIRDTVGEPEYYYVQVIDVSDLGHHIESRTIDQAYQELVSQLPKPQRHSNISYEVLSLYRQQNIRTSAHMGNIAHELKNRLNGVLGFNNIMRHCYEVGNGEKANKAKSSFDSSIAMLSHTINELLDLSYIDSGQLRLNRSHFDLIELLQTITQAIEPMSKEHDIPVYFVSNINELNINSDKDRVWEIVSNLLSNAIKYTEQGKVELGVESKGDEVIIQVKDTGIGIEAEDIHAIFDEFQKVHSGLKKQVDSTGLGLPITKRLIQLLGGNIDVESKPGIGTIFMVTLPVNLGDKERSGDLTH